MFDFDGKALTKVSKDNNNKYNQFVFFENVAFYN